MGRMGGMGRTGGTVVASRSSPFSCLSGLSCPSRLSRRRRRRRHEQISLVPDEVVFAVDGELVVLAHEDRADRTGLFAVPAEDAPRLVDLVDRGVARTRLDRPVVLDSLEVDRIR